MACLVTKWFFLHQFAFAGHVSRQHSENQKETCNCCETFVVKVSVSMILHNCPLMRKHCCLHFHLSFPLKTHHCISGSFNMSSFHALACQDVTPSFERMWWVCVSVYCIHWMYFTVFHADCFFSDGAFLKRKSSRVYTVLKTSRPNAILYLVSLLCLNKQSSARSHK